MRNKTVQAFFLLLICICAVAEYIPTSRQTAIAEYSHKRVIIIDNTDSAEALRNYQVKVKLDPTNFHFNEAMDSGEDIRFTDGDDVTPLDFWIEKWNKTEQMAIIWVEVPLIPSQAEKTIYLYYGKPDETSASNGEATFAFFDDFTGNMSKWFSDGKVSNEENELKLQGSTYVRSNVVLSAGNYRIFCKICGEGKFILCYVDASTGNGYGFSEETNGMFKGYMLSASGLRWIGGADGPADKNVIYILENGRLGEYNYGVAIDSDYYSIAMVRSHKVSISNFVVQLKTLEGTYYVDYVAVRKYNRSEPRIIVVSEHDLSLLVDAPHYTHPGSFVNVTSTIRNKGIYADIHVKVRFFDNGYLVNLTEIPQLNAGESVLLSFPWHSSNIEGDHNLTVYVVPVSQEINTTNNQVSEIVKIIKLSLSLSPEKGFASVTLVGSGFADHSKITVTWDEERVSTVPSPIVTDTYGRFTALISVPTPNDPGSHIVKAADEKGTELEATFTVLEMRVPLEYIFTLTVPAFIAICLATYTLILCRRRETKLRNRFNVETNKD